MKKGAHEHPKMYALAEALGKEHMFAVGLIDTICAYAADYAKDGNLGKIPKTLISRWIHQTKQETDAAIAAMLKTGWLDAMPDGGYEIHDWREHRPAWVSAEEARSTKIKKVGKRPNTQYRHSVPTVSVETETAHSDSAVRPDTSPLPIPTLPIPTASAGDAAAAPADPSVVRILQLAGIGNPVKAAKEPHATLPRVVWVAREVAAGRRKPGWAVMALRDGYDLPEGFEAEVDRDEARHRRMLLGLAGDPSVPPIDAEAMRQAGREHLGNRDFDEAVCREAQETGTLSMAGLNPHIPDDRIRAKWSTAYALIRRAAAIVDARKGDAA